MTKEEIEKYKERTINGYDLVRTCTACPQEYDVYKNGEQVGYLRLRHGTFRADVPDCGGKTVYLSHPKGDGTFYDDEEDLYLTRAINAIDSYLKDQEAQGN